MRTCNKSDSSIIQFGLLKGYTVEVTVTKYCPEHEMQSHLLKLQVLLWLVQKLRPRNSHVFLLLLSQ